MSFLAPILIFEISTAILLCICWGIFIMIVLTYFIARNNKKKPLRPIMEHVLVTVVVIALTHITGKGISLYFSREPASILN